MSIYQVGSSDAHPADATEGYQQGQGLAISAGRRSDDDHRPEARRRIRFGSPSLARNVLSNWVVTAAAIGYSLVITPIVIRALNAEMYGVWSFINGLVAYSDLLYLGLGSALVRYIAEFAARNDQPAINRVTSVGLTILGFLGLTCFVTLFALSTWIPALLARPLPTDTAHAATVTCVLVGVQLCLFFIGSTFTALLLGHERYDVVNVARLLIIVTRFVLIPSVVAGPNALLKLATFMTITTAVEIAALAILAWIVNPSLRLSPARPQRTELRQLYGFGVQSFLIVFAVKLISYTDTTVIGVTLGAASVAQYVLPLQLIDYVRTTLAGFTTVFLPRLTVLHSQGDVPALAAAYLHSSRVTSALAAFLLTNLVILGPAFLRLWAGEPFGSSVRGVIFCLALAALLQVFVTIVPLAFYQAMHLLKVPARVLLLEALLNLGLSLALVQRFGLLGVALSTVLPAFCVSFMILPRYLCQKLSVPLLTYLDATLRPALLIAISIAVAHWIAAIYIPAHSYASLAARAVLSLPPAILVAFYALPIDERLATLQFAGRWRRRA